MSSTTNFRRTRILVTKLIRLTIETGSVTGIYFVPSAVVKTITPVTFSFYRSAQLCPFYCASLSNLIPNSRRARA